MDYIVDIETGTIMYLHDARIVRNFRDDLDMEDEHEIVHYAIAHGEIVK